MARACIFSGLSLVSMSVNLIQNRIENTYQAGLKSQQAMTPSSDVPETLIRPALGVLQAFANIPTFEIDSEQNRPSLFRNQYVQTDISFPISKNMLLVNNDGQSKVLNHENEINILSFYPQFHNGPHAKASLPEGPTLQDITEENSLAE